MGVSSLEFSSVQLAFIAVLFTAGGALWALFRLVTSSADQVRRDGEVAINSLRDQLKAEIDKEAALASKSRHDVANFIQVQLTKLDGEIERLKRETVRREDMQAIEGRLTTAMAKMESKVDTLGERLGAFSMLEKQVQQLDRRLDALLSRLELRNPTGSAGKGD